MNRSIEIYQNGEIEIQVSVDRETIWLNTNDIASIFGVQRPAIVKHVGNIYKSGELDKNLTCSILEQVAKDRKKRKTNYYNLDLIISVGYRVNSIQATRFRQWATRVLKNYIYNGYVINENKITNERFMLLEKDMVLLKEKVGSIDTILQNKSIQPTQGIFYDGQVFDAYAFISNLIKSAKSSIKLIDNYIDESVLTLFSKNQNIHITVYTKNITKQLKLDIKKYNTQYHPIRVKQFDASHDRFLIIDDTQIYHIGASLKDLGKKWFAFSKMNEESFGILGRLLNDNLKRK